MNSQHENLDSEGLWELPFERSAAPELLRTSQRTWYPTEARRLWWWPQSN